MDTPPPKTTPELNEISRLMQLLVTVYGQAKSLDGLLQHNKSLLAEAQQELSRTNDNHLQNARRQ